MSAPMQIATIAGRKLRFVQSGDPAATSVLVLVHAFPVGVRLFEPQLSAFGGWRIIVPALPGFDGSDLLDHPSADGYGAHVLGLLDELRIDRAVFGGVSLGGYVILRVLRQAADRVSAVILADTRSTPDTPEARAARQRLLQINRQAGPSAVADDGLPKLLGATSHRTRPKLVADVRRMIEAQTADAISAAIEVLMSRPDSTSLLDGIRVPTLVIVGREDTLTPPAEMERMAAAIPGATFVQIDDAGHLSNLENPEVFNREVAGFVRSVPGEL